MKSWQDIISERILVYKAERAGLIEEIHTLISRNDALDVLVSELELLLDSNGKSEGSPEVGKRLKGTLHARASIESKESSRLRHKPGIED